MSCSRIRKHATEPDLDRHAESCPSCREWVARQRRARVATARLAQALALEAAEPSPAVEAALRRAFRDTWRPPAARPLAPAPGRLAWALCVAVAGAVAAVLIAFPGVHPTHQSPSSVAGGAGVRPAALPSPRSVPSAVAPTVAAARRSAGPDAPARPPREERAAAPVAPPGAMSAPNGAETVAALPAAGVDPGEAIRPAVAENTTEHADASAFIPLLTEPEPSVIESGQIVRVQLSEDELRAAKLPTPLGSASPTGRIEAEVLVGPDGVARGIRRARPRQ